MTSHLLVARTDGVITGTDGVMERVHRGVTLAHPDHPVALAAPQAFMPMTVHLPAPAGSDDAVMAEVTAETAELRADLDRLVDQLTTIRDMLDARGLLVGVDMAQDGWLARRLAEVLPEAAVAPPRAAAKPRKAARPPVGNDA